ncbi:UPF0158 family protein [Pontibacterium sp.]|uniref:UPF0158 family protein n=1 Tax=Pontibacterium sp. TaxID=2036026 RepID=UPI0035110E6D
MNIEDLILALDYTTSGEQFGFSAYVDKRSGEIHYEADDQIDPLPDDLYTNPEYIEIPTARDLDLGSMLVHDFVEECFSEQEETVNEIFRRKGAYAKFKELLHTHDKLDEWYRYEEEAKRNRLREWAQLNDVEISR